MIIIRRRGYAVPTKLLSEKNICLLRVNDNWIWVKMGRFLRLSLLSEVRKNQLISKYCSKYCLENDIDG